LFRSLSFRDIGDDPFQFDIAGWAEVELTHSDDIQGRAVSMDDPVLVIERRLGTDRLRQRFLQGREVVIVYAALEHLERHRIDLKIDIKHAVAFARCSRKQSSRIPAIAAHPANLLTLDHPRICLTECFEEARGFEGYGSLRSQHRYHRDTFRREYSLTL
jgi:hypothetical protein